jgi:putative transposase
MKLDDFKRPATGNQVESFLGFINYFRKFIPYYSFFANPLDKLQKLKKITKEDWNDDVEAAFTNLKAALLNVSILFFSNFKYQLQLAVDASKSGIARVLF